MTRKEYFQLLDNSRAFAKMPEWLKRYVKKARGEKRDKYIEILMAEFKEAQQAQEDFIQQVEKVTREINFLGNHTKQKLWLQKEQKARSSEDPEALLEALNGSDESFEGSL